jgi:hypothetical protein
MTTIVRPKMRERRVSGFMVHFDSESGYEVGIRLLGCWDGAGKAREGAGLVLEYGVDGVDGFLVLDEG